MSKSRTAPKPRRYPQTNDTREPVREVRPEIEKIASETAHTLLGHCEPHEVAHAINTFKETIKKGIAKLAENGTYLTGAAEAADEALG